VKWGNEYKGKETGKERTKEGQVKTAIVGQVEPYSVTKTKRDIWPFFLFVFVSRFEPN